MALLRNTFVTKDAPKNGFETIPEDDYTLQVIKSALNPTKDARGEKIDVTLEVMDGDYAGRKIFDLFNYVNKSPDAERIGKARLGELCAAIGIEELENTEQMHGIPFRGHISIEKGTGGYNDKNRLRRSFPLEGGDNNRSDSDGPVWAD